MTCATSRGGSAQGCFIMTYTPAVEMPPSRAARRHIMGSFALNMVAIVGIRGVFMGRFSGVRRFHAG